MMAAKGVLFKLPPKHRQGRCGRWTAGMRHLAHFCGDSVAGGRQGKTPGTLSREFRARWKAENDTWNAFAGIPWQVEGRK